MMISMVVDASEVSGLIWIWILVVSEIGYRGCLSVGSVFLNEDITEEYECSTVIFDDVGFGLRNLISGILTQLWILAVTEYTQIL